MISFGTWSTSTRPVSGTPPPMLYHWRIAFWKSASTAYSASKPGFCALILVNTGVKSAVPFWKKSTVASLRFRFFSAASSPDDPARPKSVSSPRKAMLPALPSLSSQVTSASSMLPSVGFTLKVHLLPPTPDRSAIDVAEALATTNGMPARSTNGMMASSAPQRECCPNIATPPVSGMDAPMRIGPSWAPANPENASAATAATATVRRILSMPILLVCLRELPRFDPGLSAVALRPRTLHLPDDGRIDDQAAEGRDGLHVQPGEPMHGLHIDRQVRQVPARRGPDRERREGMHRRVAQLAQLLVLEPVEEAESSVRCPRSGRRQGAIRRAETIRVGFSVPRRTL